MKYIIGLLTAGLLLIGCSKADEESHSGTQEMHSQTEDHTGHDHGDDEHGHDNHAQSNGITLNNGEKWQADKHTNDKVNEMKNEIANYKKSNDYTKLSLNLATDVNELIKGCTMESEPHNQLHVWLEPLLELVQGMKEASNDSDKSDKVKEIEKTLNQYSEYFK